MKRMRSNVDGVLTLHFTLTNTSSTAVEAGGLGMPMGFDNILTGRALEEAHACASFADLYIGRDAGYLQVTRLNGRPPAPVLLRACSWHCKPPSAAAHESG